MKRSLFTLTCSIFSLLSFGQPAPFSVKLEPIILKEFSGLQSYAWARAGDNIILFGGRKEGLHKRQPFASFNKTFNNSEIIMINPGTQQTIRKGLGSVPAPIAEQLQSSNMEFFQDGDYLILIGGYGYSETKNDHITFPSMLVIRLSAMVKALQSGSSIDESIIQIPDERMAITGGNLGKLDDAFYLIGGQRFTGRYNPHGPDHGPGYSQQYSNEIRKFQLNFKNGTPAIYNYEAISDTSLFHRRDYNLVNQYDENGNEILSVYSGVFQSTADLPFTTLVDISPSGYKLVPEFNQQLNHYHSAHLPLYDSINRNQFVIFFGGIAWNYLDNNGKLNKDDNVPFVKTISVVERTRAGIKEYSLTERMPGYFGASASFIARDPLMFTKNGNLKWDSIGDKPSLVGYIIGGIDSRAPNILWSNDPLESRASPVIWEVFISRTGR